jgi:xanthine dehydrogenase YagR molybdenum-binding subunit
VQTDTAKNLIGQPLSRTDGPLKVTGKTPYAEDLRVDNLAYGYLVTSTIARGRINKMDLSAAAALPGVLKIYTAADVKGRVKPTTSQPNVGFGPSKFYPMQDDRIVYAGQIIGFVVAETYETAREAARRIRVDYSAEPVAASFDSPQARTLTLEEAGVGNSNLSKGNVTAALEQAAHRVDADYETSPQVHNSMELYSSTCFWENGKLIFHEPSQWLGVMQHGLAEQFGLNPEDVIIRSPYVGGGFGGKGALVPRMALAALAARDLKRPIRSVDTRAQGFITIGHRAETRHRIQLGATAEGKLTAYRHESWETTSRSDVVSMNGAYNTARLYQCENMESRLNVTEVDRATPAAMRSPPEVPFVFPLECAMDELAYKAGIDPVDFRLQNDAKKDPITGNPFTSRSLDECYRQAAEQFGWRRRTAQPGSMRDQDWHIGWGCASTLYPTYLGAATARVSISQHGKALVAVASHDMGTGAYTVLGQIAAEKLGIPPAAVTVELGDSRFPPAPYSGGSITTGIVGSAIVVACETIRRRLGNQPGSIFALLEASGQGFIEEIGQWFPPSFKPDSIAALYKGRVHGGGGGWMEGRLAYAFGAHFVEVAVHRLTREIRMRRSVSAFAAGRIINEKTARSQLMGGVIWGISSALHEKIELDMPNARYVNDNLGEYLIPVNADIGTVDIIMVPEVDDTVGPLGVKGIGELGNVGMDAAVANAVFHATGKRIRHLPIRIEDLLPG